MTDALKRELIYVTLLVTFKANSVIIHIYPLYHFKLNHYHFKHQHIFYNSLYSEIFNVT